MAKNPRRWVLESLRLINRGNRLTVDQWNVDGRIFDGQMGGRPRQPHEYPGELPGYTNPAPPKDWPAEDIRPHYWAFVEKGIYVDSSFDDDTYGRVVDAEWVRDEDEPERIARLNDDRTITWNEE